MEEEFSCALCNALVRLCEQKGGEEGKNFCKQQLKEIIEGKKDFNEGFAEIEKRYPGILTEVLS